MVLVTDPKRGKRVAEILYNQIPSENTQFNSYMPEDILPRGVARGSLEHINFITLTVSIDYQRNAIKLWESSRKCFEDPETRYLFDPDVLQTISHEMIIKDMKKHGLSKKPIKDAGIWARVSKSFSQNWNGDPREFLRDCDWNALQVLKTLKTNRSDYPYLSGNKIAPLWLRMLRDNVGITNFKNLDKVPIPVDIHVARATLATGVVSGQFRGSLDSIFEFIRAAWFESVKGLNANNRPMMALDIDEPLWHLSKEGCTKRDKITGQCPVKSCKVKEFCIRGKIYIEKSQIEVAIYE